jgi:hypothetical protein
MKLSSYLQAAFIFLAAASVQQHALAAGSSKRLSNVDSVNPNIGDELRTHRSLRGRRPHPNPNYNNGGGGGASGDALDVGAVEDRATIGLDLFRADDHAKQAESETQQDISSGRYCASIRDCPSGYRCKDNACFLDKISCLSFRDCPSGNRCTANTCIPIPTPQCPEPDTTNMGCIAVVAPVTCDGGCTYNNMCLARLAGMGIDTCTPVPPTPRCPEPDPNRACITAFAPVTCDGGCTYSNMCFAQAAGMRRVSCKRNRLSNEP